MPTQAAARAAEAVETASALEESTAGEKVRLSLDVSPQLNKVLEDLAKRTGRSKSDVLRQAIALIQVASNAKREGKKIGIAEESDQLSTEIVGLF